MKKILFELVFGISVVLICNSLAFAVLPPQYEKQREDELKEQAKEMQKNAPEVVVIEVLKVDVKTPSEEELETKKICWEMINIKVRILEIKKTTAGLEAGDEIHVSYVREVSMVPGPAIYNPPILQEGQKVVAYLKQVKSKKSFTIAAGILSFE